MLRMEFVCYLLWIPIDVTSFSSISYCSNSELVSKLLFLDTLFLLWSQTSLIPTIWLMIFSLLTYMYSLEHFFWLYKNLKNGNNKLLLVKLPFKLFVPSFILNETGRVPEGDIFYLFRYFNGWTKPKCWGGLLK